LKIAMKQRLVGTIVLGCLAIIFIPILLDGEGVTPQEMTSTIPEAPPLPVVPDVEPTRPEITADVNETQENGIRTETDTPARESEPDTALTADTPPPAPERPSLDSNGIPATWAVRLGSFGEMANAEALVQRLRDQGYKGFSRPLSTSRGVLTGVYVGPVVTESDAGNLQQELADAFGLDGIVVRFSIDELGQ